MNLCWRLLPWLRRLACAAALAATALLLVAAACCLAGLRINTSPSIPIGLYRMSEQPLARGRQVLLCPPHTPLFALALQRGYLGAGFCPGGYGYLMKTVSAAEGDQVRFAADGVRVNGRLLAASAALPVDQAGRRLPHHAPGCVTLGPDQLLLMSARGTAWDARYFGPVARAQIEGVIVPLLTWPDGTGAPPAATWPALAPARSNAFVGRHLPGPDLRSTAIPANTTTSQKECST